MTSSTPFLVLMMICSKSFLKSASGTYKFISVQTQMSMKLQENKRTLTRTKSNPRHLNQNNKALNQNSKGLTEMEWAVPAAAKSVAS